MNGSISSDGAGMAQPKSLAGMVGKLGFGAAALGMAAFGAGVLASNGIAPATVITVLDPGFVNPAVTNGNYTGHGNVTPGNDTVIPDWGINNWQGSSGYVGGGDRNSSGTYYAFISYPIGAIYQDIGAIQPDTTYSLSVQVLENPGGWGTGSTGVIALVNTAADSNTTTQSAQGTLLASNSVVVSHTANTIMATYTTGSVVSGDLTIALSVIAPNPANSNGSVEADFTNVSLTTVPEPAALGLLGVGGLALLLVGRKRKQASVRV